MGNFDKEDTIIIIIIINDIMLLLNEIYFSVCNRVGSAILWG